MATDPVCGMTVNEATALRADRDGQPFFFCSEHCRRTFLNGGAASVPAAPAHAHHRAEPTPPASPAPVSLPVNRTVSISDDSAADGPTWRLEVTEAPRSGGSIHGPPPGLVFTTATPSVCSPSTTPIRSS